MRCCTSVPQGFRVIGPLSWAGEIVHRISRRAPRRPARGVQASDKPAVFVLPGILGSNLKVDGKRIWLGWRLVNGLGAPRATRTAGPTASSPMGSRSAVRMTTS